jgi:ABC-type bacteriocin/lantibiotic exporter with double-glycine peptidase domain
MVLSSFGVEATEAEIRRLCDCTESGTDALKAVDAARQLGFPGTRKHNLLPDELKTSVEEGNYPIVFVNLFPLRGSFDQHALVVIEMNEESVTVYDPLVGECRLPMEKFSVAWRMQRTVAACRASCGLSPG